MSANQLAEKRVEQAPVQEVKKDNMVSKKLSSVIFVCIAFVLLYLSLGTGSETMMWAGLGVTALSQVIMYLRF